MLPSISLLRLSCRPGANAFLRGTRTANQSSGVRSVVSLIRPSVSRDLQSPSCQHFLRYSSQKSVEARSLHSLSCRFQEINPRKGDKEKDTSAIQKSEQEKRENRMIFVRKVVDQAKDTSYILALIAFGGFVVLGIGKSLWTYLLSPNSSQRLYSKAVKMAKKVMSPTRREQEQLISPHRTHPKFRHLESCFMNHFLFIQSRFVGCLSGLCLPHILTHSDPLHTGCGYCDVVRRAHDSARRGH